MISLQLPKFKLSASVVGFASSLVPKEIPVSCDAVREYTQYDVKREGGRPSRYERFARTDVKLSVYVRAKWNETRSKGKLICVVRASKVGKISSLRNSPEMTLRLL